MHIAEIFLSGKSLAACCCAVGMTAAEWCWGDPTTPDGRGLALVCVLLLVDFLLGNMVALLARPVEWEFARFRRALTKLLTWGSLLLIARRFAEPIGIVWADPVMHWMSDYLIVTMVFVDLGSILRHLRRLSALGNVRTPMLDRAFDAIDAMTERIMKKKEEETKS